MHTKEIIIRELTDVELQKLKQEAKNLSPRHEHALHDQIERQIRQ